MQEGSSDFLTRAVGYVLGFLSLGGMLGYLQYRLAARRAPVDIRLTAAQAEVQHATAEEIRAKVRREDENAVVTSLRTLAQDLRADVERLRSDRDYWQARAEKAERHLLEQELELPPKPGNGKGN